MHGTQKYTVTSATIRGAEAIPVTVEVIVSNGMPGISIVGMPDAAVQEAKERFRAAMKSCGLQLPGEKIVFNLAPGALKKTGSGFDLPMAVALLAATKQIPLEPLEGKLIVGELSLDGSIRPVNGIVAFQTCAFEHGLDLLCAYNSEALGCIEAGKVYTAKSLRSFVKGDFQKGLSQDSCDDIDYLDYADVGGQQNAKRAMQIAAAGNHGILMMGPPGSGKTMLAKRLPSILPSLSTQEIAESARIASIVNEPIEHILQGIRPFRAPHHSTTLAGLIGGGSPVRPGEVSLAHNGVLMLDELPEFSRSVLQGLRQPIEDGKVSITRADGNVVMPAKFMLVASSNPCPCGYFGDQHISCTCPLPRVHAYQNKIGGPLLDRIDICIDVWRTEFDDVIAGDISMDSDTLKAGVLQAREFAYERFKTSKNESYAGQSVNALMSVCRLQNRAKTYFKHMAQSYVLSGRGIMRTLRVARTIADLACSGEVLEEHIAEALSLRVRTGEAATW